MAQRLAGALDAAARHADARGAPEAAFDLTGFLRGMEWPAASQHLVNLLAISGDPAQPFKVELGQALLIDPETPVTYLHPVTLHRTGQSPAASGVLASADGHEVISEALQRDLEAVRTGFPALVLPEGDGQ